MTVCADGAFYRTHHRSTYGAHLPIHILGAVHNFYSFLRNNHLFRVGFMFCKILHINIAEVAQTGMQSDVGKVNSFNLHALHQLAAEMQARRRSSYSTLITGKNRLETFRILRFYRTVDDAVRQRSFAQRIQSFLELVMRPVVKKTESTSA